MHTGFVLSFKVHRLNHEVIFFLPCWWEEVGFSRRRELCSAPSCSFISVCSRRIPGPVQGDKDPVSAASLWLQPTQVPLFSYKDELTTAPGMGGAEGLTLVISIGKLLIFRSFLTVWMPDTWHLGKSRESPQGCRTRLSASSSNEILLGRRPSGQTNDGFEKQFFWGD